MGVSCYHSNDDGVLLSVVAADITESSLSASVREALNDTLCEEEGYEWVPHPL